MREKDIANCLHQRLLLLSRLECFEQSTVEIQDFVVVEKDIFDDVVKALRGNDVACTERCNKDL
jgi:hypothetical protein